MNSQDTTYVDRLKISWLLFWRGTLVGLAFAFIWGRLVGLAWETLELSPDWGQGVTLFGGYVFSVVFVGPLLIQMILRKRFSGFRVEFVRTGDVPKTFQSN